MGRQLMNIGFWLASNLQGEARETARKAGITEGLVAVKIYVGSPPEFDVEPVTNSPTEYLREFAEKEGLNLDKIVVDALGEYPEV